MIEDDDFYSVRTYKDEQIATISTQLHFIKGSRRIDYALFDTTKNQEHAWGIGNSDNISIGDNIMLVGFPDYIEGNSPDIQNAQVNSKRIWMEQELYTVDKRIVHGSSGGLVLNKGDKKVIGIIKCGSANLKETEDNAIQGFIPINNVLKDLE